MLFALLIQGNEWKWESKVPRLWVWRLRYYIIRSGRLFSRLQQSLRDACPKSEVWMAEAEATSPSLNSINFYQNIWCHILVPFLRNSLPYFIHIYTVPYSRKNTVFRKLDLFPFSSARVGRHLLRQFWQKQLFLATGNRYFWRTQMNMCLCTPAYGDGNRSRLHKVVFLLE